MQWSIRYLVYGLSFIITRHILGRKIPLIGGLVVGDQCNLECLHCNASSGNDPADMSFSDIKEGINILYEKGIRLLAITGGEPFLWRDGKHTLEDIILFAREKRFLIISVYTNGTMPLISSGDNLFVSLDGNRETSHKLRGSVYDRVITNLQQTQHPKIIINCTINNINKNDIEEICSTIFKIPTVQGIFFFFHTPYYGIDELFIPFPERQKIILKIIELKKKYKILNSRAALWDVYRDSWARPSDICLVYANKKIYQCCRSIGKDEVCRECGYLGYPEVINIAGLKLSAVLTGFNYRPRWWYK